ncbi:MAG TPA: ABC transporter ATP-binding protein [Bacteroidota bacterium]|nr:ABC transporter ATP-binding protein [Bacteroidota bacterium]
MKNLLNNGRAVNVRGLNKIYGSGAVAFQALKDVDFHADVGEFLMLSGPSGSGKTTLLSILGCVLRPTSGEVFLFDRDIAPAREDEMPSLRINLIGFVFQGFNLIASLSASENIALVLQLRGWQPKEARREAMKLLTDVGIPEKGNSLPRDLSGGQRQRVAIARAMAGRPPLILADEPTANLDGHTGLQVTTMLKELARVHGSTVVVVTHDNRIFHLADRLVHIEDGRIRKE